MNNLIVMAHKKSKVTITVPRSQMANAVYHGWYEFKPGAEKIASKKEVKKNG